MNVESGFVRVVVVDVVVVIVVVVVIDQPSSLCDHLVSQHANVS